MKKQFLLLSIILFCTISCIQQNTKPEIEKVEVVKLPTINNQNQKYLLNPPKTDTLCISDIERAKKDLIKYEKLFIKTICLGCKAKPYEAEIEEVLKKRNIKLVIEDIGCVGYEGQTQGCYSGFIELKMKEKFGVEYFNDIEKEAEKIFIDNIDKENKVVSVFDLDDKEIPKIMSPKIYIASDYYTTMKVDLPIKIDTYKSLFVDITFIIEKDGTISNLSISNWVNDAISEKFKTELIDYALKTLKQDYNRWRPGKYKGIIVRTKNTLRINFET
jgi:hypothetical protein